MSYRRSNTCLKSYARLTSTLLIGLVVLLLSSNAFSTDVPTTAKRGTSTCKPLIIDHDGGTDDYIALLYMLGDKKYCIKAITTVTGIADAPRATLGTLRILSKLNRSKIAIAQGITNQPHSFAEFIKKVQDKLPDSKSLAPSAAEIKQEKIDLRGFPTAEKALTNIFQTSKAPVTVLAIGPLSNIARYFRKHPKHLKLVERIVIMGGAVRVDGNSHSQPKKVSDISSEYNFFIDPESAAYVLNLPVPIQLVPLDATNYAFLRPAYIDRLHEESFTAAKIASDLLESERQFLEIEPGLAIYDGLAALALSHPELMTWEDIYINVNAAEPASGRTRPLTCTNKSAMKCRGKRKINVAVASWRRDIYDALTKGLRYNASR